MKKKKTILILIVAGLVMAGAVVAFLVLSGGKILPGVCPRSAKSAPVVDRTVTAEQATVTEWYDAVGTVQPSTQARIEAQIPAQINEVRVNAGDIVEKGQLLIVLDSRQMQARLSQAQQSLKTAVSQREQARQAVNAAQAAFDEAESAYQRVKNFYDAKAATEQSLEQALSRYQQAKAAVKRAKDAVSGALAGVRLAEEMVAEAKIAFGYTEIKAPADGKVLKRMADPGDLAMPGKPLLLVRTTGGLRLEAHVRESLIDKVPLGSDLRVKLTALEKTVDTRVEEVIPYADPRTRTFLVKATLPDLPGLYPGMYGKLLIPYKEISLVLIPPEAVVRVGQLELVSVQTGDGWGRRYVKTGHMYGDRIEVLSGLSGGETLKVEEPDNDR